MQKQFVFIFITMMIAAMFGCSKSPEIPVALTEHHIDPVENNHINFSPPEFYRDGITPMTEVGSMVKTNSIDPENFEIIFQDHYNDCFYLRRTVIADGFFLYKGIWQTHISMENSSNTFFDVYAIFDWNSNTLTVIAQYKENSTFCYFLREHDHDGRTYFGNGSTMPSASQQNTNFSLAYIFVHKGHFGRYPY